MKPVKEIIESKKTADTQATSQIITINTRMELLDSARKQYQNEINNIKNDLLRTIRELKQICTYFNLPEEVASKIQKLRQEAKIAGDLNSGQKFNNTADAIEQLLRQL
jgi:transcription initiation factor TFIIIB Brf1 subunit/transcription initiation factor TFIIB